MGEGEGGGVSRSLELEGGVATLTIVKKIISVQNVLHKHQTTFTQFSKTKTPHSHNLSPTIYYFRAFPQVN